MDRTDEFREEVSEFLEEMKKGCAAGIKHLGDEHGILQNKIYTIEIIQEQFHLFPGKIGKWYPDQDEGKKKASDKVEKLYEAIEKLYLIILETLKYYPAQEGALLKLDLRESMEKIRASNDSCHTE